MHRFSPQLLQLMYSRQFPHRMRPLKLPQQRHRQSPQQPKRLQKKQRKRQQLQLLRTQRQIPRIMTTAATQAMRLQQKRLMLNPRNPRSRQRCPSSLWMPKVI